MRIRGLTVANLVELARTAYPSLPPARHVFICIADHYEPMWNRPAASIQMGRVERWARQYPEMAAGICDSRGRPPQHTFFYPQDEYLPEHLQPIADLCHRGYGDVEIHLHHDNDTAEGLREKLLTFAETLSSEHGLLRRNARGQLSYAFVHGNWALNNSRADGRWCGVNNELAVLLETGCYADMTMPSAPADCQTTTINSIYYAKHNPHSPKKSHDRGVSARAGQAQPADSLMMIQGPLSFDCSKRKWGLLPGIENGDLTGNRPPTVHRLGLWMQAGVRVVGREEWSFIKLHTHGAQEANSAMLLGEPMRQFHKSLAKYAERNDFKYYYVTALEMAALVRQAELGFVEPSFEPRDLELFGAAARRDTHAVI